MNVIDHLQIPRQSKIEIFGKGALKEAMSYASLPYDELSVYGHYSPQEVADFINGYGSRDILVVSRRKGKLGTIQECYIDENGNLVKRNYIVKPSATLGPYSEVIKDKAGNITHTIVDSKGHKSSYSLQIRKGYLKIAEGALNMARKIR